MAVAGGGVASIGFDAHLTIANSTIRNNSSLFYGGAGVYNYEGTLTITQSTIRDNSSQFSESYGGGIASTFGITTISNSTITGNHAGQTGGGITCEQCTITDSVVSNNHVVPQEGESGSGGGISGGQGLTLLRCTISNNTVSSNYGRGGGISYGGGGPFTITDSTISNNQANYSGGGVEGYNTIIITNSTISGNHAGSPSISGSGYGGGVNCSENVIIQNSTLSNNSSLLDGGAIFNFGHLIITNSTISDNAAGGSGGGIYNSEYKMVELTNSIFKTGKSGANVFNSNQGTITSHGYNLANDNGSGFFNQIGDLPDTNPILGPLQNNGGPTFTHELLPGSPAINVGNPDFTPPPLTDQRGAGYDRIFGGRVDIGAFEVQALLPTPTPSTTPPTNGKIVFVSERGPGFQSDIWVMDPDGSNQTNLTNNPSYDYDPAWSPDGTKIAFTSHRNKDNPDIYVMNADGSNPIRLTNSGGRDRHAAWSPDGTKIAFDSDRAELAADIYVMNADGSNQIRLTDTPSGSNTNPAWSPNGAKIAFQSERDSTGGPEIYVMDANGANPVRLTTNWDFDVSPHWSPDGTKIVFVSDRDGADAIYLMNSNGSNPHALTMHKFGADADPAWSPDGQKIVFSEAQNGNLEIYVMNADGSNQTALTNDPARDDRPSWGIGAPATPSPTPTATPTATTTPTPTPSPTPLPSPAQLGNISTRLGVQTGNNILIAGFIVTGTEPKTVAVRGIGPSLGAFGIPGLLANPTLELRAANGTLIMQNDNWADDLTQAAALAALGLAPHDGLEPAVVTTLSNGASYTAIMAGKDDGTGLGLVEVYDANTGVASQLANISTRGFVQSGNDVMIGGLILSGASATHVVLRGIGPSLTLFGVPDALPDPTLELRDSNGTLLIANDNWEQDPTSAAALTANGLAPHDSHEAGIYISLPPGLYTAILAGKNGGTGVGLVEIYNLQ